MVSQSKVNDLRFWERWKRSGAVENMTAANSRTATRRLLTNFINEGEGLELILAAFEQGKFTERKILEKACTELSERQRNDEAAKLAKKHELGNHGMYEFLHVQDLAEKGRTPWGFQHTWKRNDLIAKVFMSQGNLWSASSYLESPDKERLIARAITKDLESGRPSTLLAGANHCTYGFEREDPEKPWAKYLTRRAMIRAVKLVRERGQDSRRTLSRVIEHLETYGPWEKVQKNRFLGRLNDLAADQANLEYKSIVKRIEEAAEQIRELEKGLGRRAAWSSVMGEGYEEARIRGISNLRHYASKERDALAKFSLGAAIAYSESGETEREAAAWERVKPLVLAGAYKHSTNNILKIIGDDEFTYQLTLTEVFRDDRPWGKMAKLDRAINLGKKLGKPKVELDNLYDKAIEFGIRDDPGFGGMDGDTNPRDVVTFAEEYNGPEAALDVMLRLRWNREAVDYAMQHGFKDKAQELAEPLFEGYDKAGEIKNGLLLAKVIDDTERIELYQARGTQG